MKKAKLEDVNMHTVGVAFLFNNLLLINNRTSLPPHQPSPTTCRLKNINDSKPFG